MGISEKEGTAEGKGEDQKKDESVSTSGPMTRKRKRDATAAPSKEENLVTEGMVEEEVEPAKASPTKMARTSLTKKAETAPTKKRNAKDEEKRLRRFRDHAPASYLEKLHRATTQRMFVIDRTRGGTEDNPEETIDMAGTTGNIYSITISQVPSCTCPDNRKGNQCKHIVYVLHNVLKAPEHLQYQLAFLSSELREIFAAAPAPASCETSASSDSSSHRKQISGDCPICFTEFEPDNEEIVWCKAACGNNIHKTCFEQWAKSKSGSGVSCIYCRTPWQGDEESIKRVKSSGRINGDGYVNVAGELGLSGARDYSTYHQQWVRQQGFGYY